MQLLHKIVIAHDVRVSLLLANERGIGQAFDGRRRFHGQSEPLIASAHTLPLRRREELVQLFVDGLIRHLAVD